MSDKKHEGWYREDIVWSDETVNEVYDYLFMEGYIISDDILTCPDEHSINLLSKRTIECEMEKTKMNEGTSTWTFVLPLDLVLAPDLKH